MDAIVGSFRIVVLVLITWLIAEAIKLATDLFKQKELNLRVLLGYGGFPSSHSTFMCALTSSIYIVDGFTTPFLIALALSILVIRDVITMRRSIDNNTLAIAKIAKKKQNVNLISHSYCEIIAGVVLGLLGPIILNLFI